MLFKQHFFTKIARQNVEPKRRVTRIASLFRSEAYISPVEEAALSYLINYNQKNEKSAISMHIILNHHTETLRMFLFFSCIL